MLAAALGNGSRAAEVRLAFAWPNATTPMEVLHKNTSQLSHKDDLLIFERNITTGKTAEFDVPQMVRPCLLLSPSESSACLSTFPAAAVLQQLADICKPKLPSLGCHFDLDVYCMQALSYAGYPIVEALHTAPALDEPIVQGNQSIAVRGAADGLMFGPTSDTRSQTVFDTAFYRPVNTTFTGDACCQKSFSCFEHSSQARLHAMSCAHHAPIPSKSC